MHLKKYAEKIFFGFFLFFIEEIFMFCIGEYSKTYLCKSILSNGRLADAFLTLILYGIMIFVTHFIIFFSLFKEQTIFLENKNYQKKILFCFVLMLTCELVKLIFFKFSEEKISFVYFIINTIFLLGSQFIIFKMFNEDKFIKSKIIVNKKFCIVPIIILICGVAAICIFEHKIGKVNNIVNKSSLKFKFSIVLVLVSAFLQASFLAAFEEKQSDKNRNVKQKIILMVAVVICAVILYFVKLLLPEGMISQIHNNSCNEKNYDTQNKFSINYFVKEVYRSHDRKNILFYYSKTSDVYYGDEKICSYNRNDPKQSGEIECFFDGDYFGIAEDNALIVYKTSDGDFEYYFYNGKKSEGFDENLLKKEFIEKANNT